jgi:hypothetical protein
MNSNHDQITARRRKRGWRACANTAAGLVFFKRQQFLIKYISLIPAPSMIISNGNSIQYLFKNNALPILNLILAMDVIALKLTTL